MKKAALITMLAVLALFMGACTSGDNSNLYVFSWVKSAQGASTLTQSTDAKLSAEIGESGADKN